MRKKRRKKKKSTKINEKAHKAWEELKTLRSCGELPNGVILSLTTEDPRFSFPPPPAKLVLSSADEKGGKDQHLAKTNLIINWPKDVAESDIWDEKIRNFSGNKTKMNEISRQKKEKSYPHSYPGPSIPILLIQRDGGAQSLSLLPSNNNQKRKEKQRITTQSEKEFASGWSIILPKGWGMAYWISMVLRWISCDWIKRLSENSIRKICSLFSI